MKRLLTVLILFVILLSGCGAKNGFGQIQVCGFSNSVSEINPRLEYTKWSKDAYVDSKQTKSMAVAINGTDYAGEYVNSDYAFGTYELRHTYKTANNIYFEVDSDRKPIACFWGEQESSGSEKSQADCEKIAEDLISETTGCSLKDYQKSVRFDEELGLYTVTYIKYIGSIESEDQAEVQIDRYGNAYSFRATMLGKISVDNVPTFDLHSIDEEITKKLDTLTKDARKSYDSVEYGDFVYTLSMTDPDAYALLCTVDVKCINRAGEYDMETGEKIQFVISLE